MRSFGSRLRHLRSSAGLTQEEFAKKFQISKSAVGMYERDEREPSFDLVQKFAQFFGVTTDFLIGPTDDPSPRNRAREEISRSIAELKGAIDVVYVPLLGSIHAGDPIPPIEETDAMMVPISEIKLGKKYFGLRVKGDCMAYGPNPIHDGDMVLVERRPDVENSHIAVVMLPDEDEAVLRRVYYTREGVILTADNPRYPPIVVRGKDIRIYGQVVNYVSRPAAAKDVRNHIQGDE